MWQIAYAQDEHWTTTAPREVTLEKDIPASNIKKFEQLSINKRMKLCDFEDVKTKQTFEKKKICLWQGCTENMKKYLDLCFLIEYFY